MIANESNRRRMVIILFATIVFLLIIVSWVYYLFSPQNVCKALNFQLSNDIYYIILEKRSGTASKIRSVDDTQLNEIMDILEVRYCGPFWGTLRIERFQSIYQISFYKKGLDRYQNLGQIIIDENECIYANHAKYKALDKEVYHEFLDLLETETAT